MTQAPAEAFDGQTLLSPEYLAALDVMPNFKFTPELLTAIREQGIQMPFERTGLAIYAIHGGGYVIGTYEMLDATFERYCARLGCVGLSVEYRLAPEHAYPAALDDCYAG